MEKYSINIEAEIDSILDSFHSWKNLFTINIEHFVDGWAIFLREKRAGPRKIIIFKSYENDSYSIKSSEILFNGLMKREEEIELYTIEDIVRKEQLVKELRAVIYGKDIINFASNKLRQYFPLC